MTNQAQIIREAQEAKQRRRREEVDVEVMRVSAAVSRLERRRREAPRSRAPRRTNATAATTAGGIAALVEPGFYHGPPWQVLDAEWRGAEIDYRKARFRRKKRGVGKCTGDKLKKVQASYAMAYVMAKSAHDEVRHIIDHGSNPLVLWHGSVHHPEASLAHWFGENYSGAQTSRMLHKIEDMLAEWSTAFEAGFRDILPVYIRCKSADPVFGNPPARHWARNTIELMPDYFDMDRHKRDITMLHEMGHQCKSTFKPRDESHRLCSGGWKRGDDMCYREKADMNVAEDDFGNPVKPHDRLFKTGNPRILAQAASRGDVSARKALLNNIDNYVCFMWNRYVDRSEQTLVLLPPKSKPPRPTTAPGKAPSS
ncbi:MAG: hypothetical protein AAF567_15595 [Actinomycetota bacterium]